MVDVEDGPDADDGGAADAVGREEGLVWVVLGGEGRGGVGRMKWK